MAHAQKIKKQGVIGLVIHCERREGCELSNQDIDKSRTHLNYNLACNIQPMKPEQFLKKRISEVKHLKRDDIIYMVDWIPTNYHLITRLCMPKNLKINRYGMIS